MMKKLTASICALACAVSLIVPTTEVNANAVTKNIETASVIETKTVASTTETSTLPVISKSTDEITENCLSGAGTVTDTNPVIYTINVATPVYFNGVAGSTGVNNGTVFILYDSTGNVKSSSSVSSGSSSDTFTRSYLAKGVYTLKVYTYSDSTESYAFSVYGYDASTSGTIKQNVTYIGYNNSTDIYKKITVKKNGCLAVASSTLYISTSGTTNMYGNQVTLCNSKKKAISAKVSTTSSGDYIRYYGVKKGTYYIKLSGSGYYTVAAKLAKAGNTIAAKKAKAKKVTSKLKSYVIPASTSKTTAWFKFNVSKAKKLTLTTAFSGYYSLNVVVYRGTKKVNSFYLYDGGKKTLKYKNYLTNKETAWPKGTYYVKVTGVQKTDNGLLQLKVK